MLKKHIYAKMINMSKTLKNWYWSLMPTAMIDEPQGKAFCYNHGHNTFRLFYVSKKFSFHYK